MANQNTLSPSLFAVLLEGAADGSVRVANLVGQVQSDQPVSWKHVSASFHKNAPGDFTVSYFRDGQQVSQEAAVAPLEAKLMVLDHVIQAIKREGEEQTNTRQGMQRVG